MGIYLVGLVYTWDLVNDMYYSDFCGQIKTVLSQATLSSLHIYKNTIIGDLHIYKNTIIGDGTVWIFSNLQKLLQTISFLELGHLVLAL